MRDKVADPVFQLKRKLEHLIENNYPDYRSKYALVTFSPEVSYSYAKSQGNKQDEYLMKVCATVNSVEELNVDEVYKVLKSL